MRGGSSHSDRRTLAARVLAAAGDVETVQAILGDHCLDLETLRRAFELAM